ncbi:MAG: hypothetical protein U5O16_05375 [Rhodococcus sp. (in: high G+C Gram-positive bacteria)]|uniref:hypothetical protein n=1 Tax=Rhodococcus sp. TaxID=1831 RepID=UPI002AD651D8|nr:hypothetical protein [Rhodococcus sp. (in: high G+C Gram-positive bacteria)]
MMKSGIKFERDEGTMKKMRHSAVRQIATSVAIPAAAIGLVLAAVSPASAHTVATTDNMACMGDPVASGIANVHQSLVAFTENVTHPTANTFHVQPGTQVFNNSTPFAMKRLENVRMVYKITDTSKFVSAAVGTAGSGYTGTPAVTRVDATLAPSATGSYLLLSGITVPAVAGATTSFVQPGITINQTDDADLYLEINRDGDAGKYANSKNFLTFTSVATFLGFEQKAATMCLATDVSSRSDSDIGSVLATNDLGGDLHP